MFALWLQKSDENIKKDLNVFYTEIKPSQKIDMNKKIAFLQAKKVFLNQKLIKEQEYILNMLLEIIKSGFINANPIICERQLLKFWDFLGHFVKIQDILVKLSNFRIFQDFRTAVSVERRYQFELKLLQVRNCFLLHLKMMAIPTSSTFNAEETSVLF